MPSIIQESSSQAELASSAPHSLLPFLQSQPQNTLTRLYQRPSSCLSIFRLLGPLERQIVMNLLWLESAVPVSTMGAWVVREHQKIYEAALETLGKLHIVPISPVKLAVHPTFKSSLRQALTGGGTQGSFGIPAEPDGKQQAPDVGKLDGYALERWETILHFMVSSGTGQESAQPAAGVTYLLKESGLMESRGGTLRITSAGFQFLLLTPHAQLWELLIHYLRLQEANNIDLVEVLSFLFMVSTMELGKEYSTENLSASQLVVMDDLRHYGLLWQRKKNYPRFSPTRLATTLTSSAPPLPTSSGLTSGPKEGFIVLETNYRVYAYTDNALQTAVLNLFITPKYRFPNLVVGSITRESVKRAMSNGITADQIISYLITHAHPQMHKNNPLLPVTVQDQIRLWELERNRTKSQEGFLYTEFASQADYEYVLNYAKQLGVVLWENHAKRCFFAAQEGHANIKSFIERKRAGM
ncbi:transcription factor Tfb2 [Schizophyllum commune Loenen D]|nr:transcription factor Tfb2 [Schizophyllum commune Loenen D]